MIIYFWDYLSFYIFSYILKMIFRLIPYSEFGLFGLFVRSNHYLGFIIVLKLQLNVDSFHNFNNIQFIVLQLLPAYEVALKIFQLSSSNLG